MKQKNDKRNLIPQHHSDLFLCCFYLPFPISLLYPPFPLGPFLGPANNSMQKNDRNFHVKRENYARQCKICPFKDNIETLKNYILLLLLLSGIRRGLFYRPQRSWREEGGYRSIKSLPGQRAVEGRGHVSDKLHASYWQADKYRIRDLVAFEVNVIHRVFHANFLFVSSLIERERITKNVYISYLHSISFII